MESWNNYFRRISSKIEKIKIRRRENMQLKMMEFMVKETVEYAEFYDQMVKLMKGICEEFNVAF